MRLSFIQNHPLYVSSYERLQELEKNRSFCRHQINHYLDVARIAYILNLEGQLGISRELIYAAGGYIYVWQEANFYGTHALGKI